MVPVTPVAQVETTDAEVETEAEQTTTRTKYVVIQESKPGAGLDLYDEKNPAVDRGEFDNLEAAEATAGMWRDSMPGWDTAVFEIEVENNS